MIPESLIKKLPQNVQNITWTHKFHLENHENLESRIDSSRKKLSWSKIQRGIFQGDALSTLLFVIALMSLDHILRKCTTGYKSQEKKNYLIYMDDIKLFAKNEKELETLIPAARIYSQNIGIKFSIEKCAMLVMKSGKWHLTDGLELPSQDKIRTLGNLQILGHLGGWHHITSGNERENS